MEPPGITRHRRPFLAPLWVSLLAALGLAAAIWVIYRSATTTVVFLVSAMERQPGTIEDPPMTAEGEERAQRLARIFGDTAAGGGLDAVYESDQRRAQQTAAPLTERLQRAPVVFAAAEARAAVARAVRQHSGGTLLMVASGPALAQMVQELTGADLATAATDDPDVIYVVSVPSFGRTHLTRIRF